MSEIFKFEIKKDDTVKFSIKIRTGEEPDIDEMTVEKLQEYQAQLEQQIEELDENEPEDQESEEYEEWADQHEELEDLLDDVIDKLEELESEESGGALMLRFLGIFFVAIGLVKLGSALIIRVKRGTANG